MVRLQAALKGKACEAVESILGFPENVDMVIETLRMSFGREDLIIKSLMTKAKMTSPPKEAKPETIITFYNAINNMVSTMQRMNCSGHLNNPCPLEEFLQKMSPQLRSHWAMYVLEHNGENNLSSYVMWLKKLAMAQSLLPATEVVINEGNKKKSSATVLNAIVEDEEGEEVKTSSKKEFVCIFCNKPKHTINRCRKFKSATVNERWQFVKQNKCCILCLRVGHIASNCKSTTKCTYDGCDKRHHQLIHNTKVVPVVEAAVMNAVITNQALLKILPVTLKSNFTVKGINSVTSQSNSKLVNLSIIKTFGKETFTLKNVKTVPKLNLTAQTVRMKKKWTHLTGVDIEMYQSATPKILIGQDHVDLIITREIREGPTNAPVASRTKLGWVLHGNVNYCKDQTDLVFNCCTNDENDALHDLVKSYFKLESLEVQNKHENAKSREDKLALKIMQETSIRANDRWMTGLLWRNKDVVLPDSRSQAAKRLRHIEKKMDRDAVFSKAYCTKIEDHIAKGYVRELTDAEAEVETNRTWYLPHFAVVNPNKPGKIRVVWDAAAKSNGVSLNNQLLTGPDLYNSLPGVLFKFRQRAVAVSADIQEMFLQIKILPEDCQAQRFLWRGEDRKQKPKIYELSVMIFGSVCSPSQAQYIKNLTAQEMEVQFPKAADAIIKRHYMDHYLDSLDTPEEAQAQIRDVIRVHKSGGFNIRNWISSHPEILANMDQDLVADGMKSIKTESQYPVERVLGVRWNPNTGALVFEVKFHKVPTEILSHQRVPTKREVLKVIMSIFDPLGFISNFHIKGKILLQEIWRSGISWDDEICNDIYIKWCEWLDELKLISSISIPRWYGFCSNSKLELHIFCDASSLAYAAVAYLRCETVDGIRVAILMSKTRVAPLKTMTIPRLELMAALMGSRISDFIKYHHDLHITDTFLWTDSQIVLRWIRSDANRYKTFIAQRLGEIDELTDVKQWNWVPTKENVADEATRNEADIDLSSNSRWLNGPSFLKMTSDTWPKEPKLKQKINADGVDEVLEYVHFKSLPSPCLPDVTKFSSLMKLLRTTAWMMRFISRCKGKLYKSTVLNPEEITNAEKMWWRSTQWECFVKEMTALTNNKSVPSCSPLKTFCPKLDGDGVMRLTSRSHNNVCEQVLLNRHHNFTILLVKHYHYIHMHCGQETVANEVRQKYWIPSLRQLIKTVQFNCPVCKELNAKPLQPMMGLLPEDRLTPYVKPFHFTGKDYFGPISVRVGRRYEKRYGVIFSCLTTRAVHLELAEKLNTDSAVMAIRRLTGLRGQINTIWSDNGRNLVGANKELKLLIKRLNNSDLNSKLVTRGIKWKFNPPASPNMGGSWERIIRSVKRAMRAILSSQVLRHEALQTLFAEVTHTLNSRPLTHVSVDPKDPEGITPNNLLCGMNTQVFQQIDVGSINLRRQWIISQKFADNFWRTWIKEYRPVIVHRTKWHKRQQNIKTDDIVIIFDESLPRNSWPLGRITAVYPGRDEIVRVVDVKTAAGST